MGSNQSSSAQPSDDSAPDNVKAALRNGRFLKTYRAQEGPVQYILKTAFIVSDINIDTHKHELDRIQEALKDSQTASAYRYTILQSDRWNRVPVQLKRPIYYITLRDRLANRRPFFEPAEQWSLAHLLLRALADLHGREVIHGSLTASNVCLTSTGWLVLTDVCGTALKPAELPSNDPTEFLYYFGGPSCSLAPERFRKKAVAEKGGDIFGAGCVLVELFTGQPALTLADVLQGNLTVKPLPPAIKAAVKHMMSDERWVDAAKYAERIKVNGHDPLFLELLEPTIAPDARIARAATQYSRVIWEAIGVRDNIVVESLPRTDIPVVMIDSIESQLEAIQRETEALLKEMEVGLVESEEKKEEPPKAKEAEERTDLQRNSLFVYLNIFTASVRHAQRPTTKLVAIHILRKLAIHATDEARLQRIVPTLVALLADSEALVRASALQTLTYTLSIIQSFPPSDAQIFTQYIFKRVAPLLTDMALIVRLSLASNLALLAVTALKFLDITHTVRLYEAVGNGGAGKVVANEDSKEDSVFNDDVHKLLDSVTQGMAKTTIDASDSHDQVPHQQIFVRSTYNVEVASLRETIARWLLQLTTDQSRLCSLSKRAILRDLEQYSCFFGLDGVMTYVLPQILSFLNERQDWELRADLFEFLPSVCSTIGRAATEEYVLPCVEIGLVDSSEQVVSRALVCLATLSQLGLVSRSIFSQTESMDNASSSLIARYGVLLLHPSEDVRYNAIDSFLAILQVVGQSDSQVFIVPALRPFCSFEPNALCLQTHEEFEEALLPPWSRDHYSMLLSEIMKQNDATGLTLPPASSNSTPDSPLSLAANDSIVTKKLVDYLKLLRRHTKSLSSLEKFNFSNTPGLSTAIEGSLKLTQNVLFPRQNGRGQEGSVPTWYEEMRKKIQGDETAMSPETGIRSVAILGDVFGLSIMGPSSNVVDAAGDGSQINENTEVDEISETIEGSFRGKWSCEATLDPGLVDTSLMVTKLKALRVPPLPPKLNGPTTTSKIQSDESGASRVFKPKIGALIATSTLVNGHNAPVVRLAVSMDQSFFISASHDGTCKIWSVSQLEETAGGLVSSASYEGHRDGTPTRVNDIAMLEGSHSVVSGSSDGSVHLWRADVTSKSSGTSSTQVTGCSLLTKLDVDEGEIMNVTSFSSSSAPIAIYSTQRGGIHSWDVRSNRSPFSLRHGPEMGTLTSLALGSDRNWFVAGTSRGLISMWDVRYHMPVKVWKHSRETRISRLATSFVSPPQQWNNPGAISDPRPYIFVASGRNECGMFDIVSRECHSCFRGVENASGAKIEDPPVLQDCKVEFHASECRLKERSQRLWASHPYTSSMTTMVGNIGAGDQSYLVTGGSDCQIRYWDFSVPSKCFIVCGQSPHSGRPTFERIDFDGKRRLIQCRQNNRGLTSSGTVFRGLHKPDVHHSDAIQDLKVVDNYCLLSCSRDCTIKAWR